MKERRRMVKNRVEVSTISRTVQTTMDNGGKTKWRAEGVCLIAKAISYIKEIGCRTTNRDLDWSTIKTKNSSMESRSITLILLRLKFIGTSLKVISYMIKDMVMVFFISVMAPNLQEGSRKEKCMARALSFSRMGMSSTLSGRKIL